MQRRLLMGLFRCRAACVGLDLMRGTRCSARCLVATALLVTNNHSELFLGAKKRLVQGCSL